MEAKILTLRRNGKEEIFISLWSLCDSAGFRDQNRLEPEKVKKFLFFVEGSLSFTELSREEAGASRGVCFLTRCPLSLT